MLAQPERKRCPAAGGQPAGRTRLHSDVVDAHGVTFRRAAVKVGGAA